MASCPPRNREPRTVKTEPIVMKVFVVPSHVPKSVVVVIMQ